MTIKLSRGLHIAVLVIAAIALTFPFLVSGLVPGHDRRVHLEYQHFFNEQIDGGDLYPRWISGLNLGRGSPIFFVQYPLPYYVAWGLGHLIPNHWGAYTETHAQGLSMVLAATLGALFTYLWCATFADSLSAMIASIVFLTLPYFFSTDLYLRNAIGEVWALALMPLAFYFVERRSEAPRRSVAGIAFVFALLLLSHLFTALLVIPVLLAYAVWRSEPAKRFSALLQTGSALALGTALAGVYTLPLLAHRHFLHPENVLKFLGANYSPLSQMFAYNRAMFPHDALDWHYLGWSARYLAAATICLIGIVCYRSRREGFAPLRFVIAGFSIVTLGLTILAGHLPRVGEIPGALPVGHELVDFRAHIFLGSFFTLLAAMLCYWSLQKAAKGGLADFLIGVALLSYLMTTRWALVVWNHVHPLWNIQFPWRFNVFLALATAGLVALASANLQKMSLRWRVLGSVLAIVLWGLVSGGIAWAGHVKDAFGGTPPVAYKSYRDESLPIYVQAANMKEAVDVVNSKRDANPDVIFIAGSGKATVNAVHPRLLELTALCENDCTLQIGQFYYPAWRARPMQGTNEIPLRAVSSGGLMEISLPPGENTVLLELPRGWAERLGLWISIIALILVIILALGISNRVSHRWKKQ